MPARLIIIGFIQLSDDGKFYYLGVERQEHNRFRFWGEIKELEGYILRVVTLDDKRTIHNAFPDRRFKL
jgi:hypothetical protein